VIFCSNLRIQEDFQIMSFTMNKGGTQMLISVASQVRIFNILNAFVSISEITCLVF